MTKFDWERVQAENRVRRRGYTFVYDDLYPSDSPVLSDRVLANRKKKQEAPNKIQRLKKLPSFLAQGPQKINSYELHEFLCEQIDQLEKHNNWTKLFQVLIELPPRIRMPVISWIEDFSPWVVTLKGKQPIRLRRRKKGEYRVQAARQSPYWTKTNESKRVD